MYDLTRDGTVDIILSRSDGRLEVLSSDRLNTATSGLSLHPYTKRFSRDIGECIQAVDCGLVNSPTYPEIVLATYSGKVIGFTTEPVRTRAVDDTYGRSSLVLANERRIVGLQQELVELKKSMETLRTGNKKRSSFLSTLTGGTVGGHADLPTTAVSSVPVDFPVTARFQLSQECSLYTISIELQVKIPYPYLPLPPIPIPPLPPLPLPPNPLYLYLP